MNTHDDDEDKEITLIRILNNGNIKFKRVLEGIDTVLELQSCILACKYKIVLFEGAELKHYRMIVWSKKYGIIKEEYYDYKENTWPIYNSLCKYINKNCITLKSKNKR